MPTRNIYTKVSKLVEFRLPYLERGIFFVWLGSIPVLLIIGQLTESKLALATAMKLIWSIWCVLIALVCCGHWINPNRDPIDKTPREGFMVFMLNMFLIFSVIPWFWNE